MIVDTTSITALATAIVSLITAIAGLITAIRSHKVGSSAQSDVNQVSNTLIDHKVLPASDLPTNGTS